MVQKLQVVRVDPVVQIIPTVRALKSQLSGATSQHLESLMHQRVKVVSCAFGMGSGSGSSER